MQIFRNSCKYFHESAITETNWHSAVHPISPLIKAKPGLNSMLSLLDKLFQFPKTIQYHSCSDIWTFFICFGFLGDAYL